MKYEYCSNIPFIMFWTDIARFLKYFRNLSNSFINILAILQHLNGIFLKYFLNITVLCGLLLIFRVIEFKWIFYPSKYLLFHFLLISFLLFHTTWRISTLLMKGICGMRTIWWVMPTQAVDSERIPTIRVMASVGSSIKALQLLLWEK